MSIVSFIEHLSKSKSINTILIIFSQVVTAKSYNTDVEGSISTSNILKTADRQNWLVKFENEYFIW